MSDKKKISKYIPLVILLATSGLVASFVRKRRPLLKGEIFLEGLAEPVEIVRDKFGIPHIFALNERDLYFGLGYISAEDRLYQMDLFKRLATGTMAEIYGEDLLNMDWWSRTIGFKRIAERSLPQLDKDGKSMVSFYCQGINKYIEKNKNRLPLEFSLLRFKPEKWDIADCLAITKFLAFPIGANWKTEIIRASLLEKFKPELVEELFPTYPDDAPTTITDEEIPQEWKEKKEKAKKEIMVRKINKTMLKNLEGFFESKAQGSNWFVLGGKKTKTGGAVLANDPHLNVNLPSFLYQVNLKSPEVSCIGAMVPGVPALVAGHNEDIAWGATNCGADSSDLYLEKIRYKGKGAVFLFKGKWEKAKVIEEKILLRGKKPVLKRVIITRHGPIINKALSAASEAGIANIIPPLKSPALEVSLKWVGMERTEEEIAGYLLPRAKNWSEFCEALSHFHIPSLNYGYADREGNIGYHVIGKTPLRKGGKVLVPKPGWDEENEWNGYILFEDLPNVINPASGFLVSANNKPVSDKYPYFLASDWESSYRSRRIVELMEARKKFSLEDIEQIQKDYTNVASLFFVSQLILAFENVFKKEKSEDEKRLSQDKSIIEALALLKNWHGEVSPESVEATIYHFFFQNLIEKILRKPLGNELFEAYINNFDISSECLRKMFKDDDSLWSRRVEHEEELGRENILILCLKEALDELEEKYGKDRKNWPWGKIHQIIFAHPFSQASKLAGKILNKGPYPTGGDNQTINSGGFLNRREKTFEQFYHAGYRQIIDLKNLKNSKYIISTGSSGNIFSPHYDDQIQLWLKAKYIPMLFAEEEIAANKKSRIIFTPARS